VVTGACTCDVASLYLVSVFGTSVLHRIPSHSFLDLVGAASHPKTVVCDFSGVCTVEPPVSYVGVLGLVLVCEVEEFDCKSLFVSGSLPISSCGCCATGGIPKM